MGRVWRGSPGVGEPLPLQTLPNVGCALAAVPALALFYRQTLIGKATHACAVNREVASLLGIPVERTLA